MTQHSDALPPEGPEPPQVPDPPQAVQPPQSGTAPLPIPGLSPYEYMHRQDAQALSALRNTPGLEPALRRFYELGIDRLIRSGYTGSHLLLGEGHYPEYFGLLASACTALGLTPAPPLYLAPGEPGAVCAGVERPIIVLYSESIEQLTESELLFLLGREAGSIHCGHLLYSEMAHMLAQVGETVGDLTLGLGALAIAPLRGALANWKQKAAFSADRAGLLACQDMDSALSALAKLAGLPPRLHAHFNREAFLAQTAEFSEHADLLDRMARWMGPWAQGNSWAVLRAAELSNWASAGDYERVLSRDTAMQKRAQGIAAQLEGLRERSLAAARGVGDDIREGAQSIRSAAEELGGRIQQGTQRASDYVSGIGEDVADSAAEALRRVQEATDELLLRGSTLGGKAGKADEFLRRSREIEEELKKKAAEKAGDLKDKLRPAGSSKPQPPAASGPAAAKDNSDGGELRSRDDI